VQFGRRILWLLHGQRDQVVISRIGCLGCNGSDLAGKISGMDRTMRVLVTQFYANLGAFLVDQISGCLTTHKADTVTGHGQFRA